MEATPTPVWAVMAELGAWAETGSSNTDTRSGPPCTSCSNAFRGWFALENRFASLVVAVGNLRAEGPECLPEELNITTTIPFLLPNCNKREKDNV